VSGHVRARFAPLDRSNFQNLTGVKDIATGIFDNLISRQAKKIIRDNEETA
jgi:hypothetical protein